MIYVDWCERLDGVENLEKLRLLGSVKILFIVKN